jgi:hypothetical protein
VAADAGWLVVLDDQHGNQTMSFGKSVPAVSGTYTLKFYVDGIEASPVPSISFTLKQQTGTPTANSLINGDDNPVVGVCSFGPILLDGSESTCASGYFVGIELSNKDWGRLGGGGGVWIGEKETQKYGPINNFDIKKFAEDRYIGFVGGQYYLVKLAVGVPWNEHTQQIYIKPSASYFTLNGKTSEKIDVAYNEAITLNGNGSTCVTGYFLSVQKSDAAGNAIGPEIMRWLTNDDVSAFGPIAAFDVKKFAGTIYPSFQFQEGEHYRVKFAVGPQWNALLKLVTITGDPCQCATWPDCFVPAGCTNTLF